MPRFADKEKQQAYVNKISKNRKGKCMGIDNPSKRPVVRQKISEKAKGRILLGLRGANNPAKRPLVREKIKNNINNKKTRFRKGAVPWNKGTTKMDNKLVEQISQKKTGQKRTLKQIERIKAGLPINHKEIARENALRNIISGKWHINSKDEEEFRLILQDNLGMIELKDFIHQYRIGNYVFDFFILRHDLVIECDGHEHQRDKRIIQLDIQKEYYLRQHNYNILRFTSKEIFNNKKFIIDKIKEKLSKL